MENPRTWGPAEQTVQDALDAFYARVQGQNVTIGLSLARQITDALRKQNLLREE